MAKANFDHIYTAEDPRQYFQTLGALDYQIPAHGSEVFSALAHEIAQTRQIETVTVTDLCCSYGINAAVLKYDATFDEVVDHYLDDECAELDRESLVARDREFFDTAPDGVPMTVIGLDASQEAISYALDAGLLDNGSAENLEEKEPSPELAAMLKSTDLVTVTGGIGYITERTIGHVLDATPTPPWLAALCLRWVDFTPIAEAGASRDLVVQRINGVTYPQRRFIDDEERSYVMSELDRLDRDAEGFETDGYHHAELIVMHPRDEAPLDSFEHVLA